MSRIIRFHRFGDANVLQLEEVTPASPAAGEVLIRTEALGMNWHDVLWRQNLAPELARLPAGLGTELSGVIEAVGAGVEGFHVGQRVASFPACTPNHYPAWGERVLMPCVALTPYPACLTPLEAAVHYCHYLYAYFGLVNLAHLQPNQWVLVTEAGHCLGPQVVQMAKALGARVIASTSEPELVPFIKGLGADQVVCTETQDLVSSIARQTQGQGVSIVMDQCGGPQMKVLGDVVAVRGKLVLYGLNGGNDAALPACEAFKKHIQFFFHSILDFTGYPELGIEPQPEAVQVALAHINQLTEAGKLRPSIARVFPFEDFVEANRYLETCPGAGRVVMQMGAS